MDLLEMIQSSNTPISGRLNPKLSEPEIGSQYGEYIKESNPLASDTEQPVQNEQVNLFDGYSPALTDNPKESYNYTTDYAEENQSVTNIQNTNNKKGFGYSPAIVNDAQQDYAAKDSFRGKGVEKNAQDSDVPNNATGSDSPMFTGYAPTIDPEQKQAASSDKYSTDQKKIWSKYASNVQDSASLLKKNFESHKEERRDENSAIYRKRVHINTNVKMVGFAPNPLMIAEEQGSGLGEVVGGAQKLLTRGLSAIGGMGGKAATAMSWLNWTCPSYAYILPPGISWVWNKAGIVRDMIPSGNPSDASLGSSLSSAANSAVSFAENFNIGYNKTLINYARSKVGDLTNASWNQGKRATAADDFKKNRILLSNDCENGRRSSVGVKDSYNKNANLGTYHYGLRQQGSDFTGAVLREKRQEAALGDNIMDNPSLYDAYTFYEFSYPLMSSVSNDYFKGIFTNLDFAAGKTAQIDFLIHTPERLKQIDEKTKINYGLPEFSYTDKNEIKDLSRICDLSKNEALNLLGWDSESRSYSNEAGINQGRFSTFRTHRKLASCPDKFTMTAHETDNYDFYKWMARYYRYYYYREKQEIPSMNTSYWLTFTTDMVHRSPYESYYYLELMYMRDFEPEFRHAIYMVVPTFNVTVTPENSYTYQTYDIQWTVIGQVKTDNYKAEETSIENELRNNKTTIGQTRTLSEETATSMNKSEAATKVPAEALANNYKGDPASVPPQDGNVIGRSSADTAPALPGS